MAGLGQGITFRTGLTLVNEQAPADRRSEVASTVFTVMYARISIPVVGDARTLRTVMPHVGVALEQTVNNGVFSLIAPRLNPTLSPHHEVGSASRTRSEVDVCPDEH